MGPKYTPISDQVGQILDQYLFQTSSGRYWTNILINILPLVADNVPTYSSISDQEG